MVCAVRKHGRVFTVFAPRHAYSLFFGNRSATQLSAAWERLWLKFFLLQDVPVETAQLKNKNHTWKKEFATVRIA